MQRKRFYDGLDDDLRAILLAQVRNLWTHASTAIEGNSLTLGETAFVLEEGLTIAGKPLKDHQEVFGHARAIELVYGMLDRPELSEEDIFLLHRAVLTDHVADIYRPVGAWKKEANFTNAIAPDGRQFMREYPAPDRIPALMTQWLERFNRNFRDAEMSEDVAIERYAELHLSFVSIHPFFDGNGRMARLLCNLPLLRSGLAPIVVPSAMRREYLDAISAYQAGIGDLPSLPSLDALPKNGAMRQFESLCREFAREGRELVSNAFRLQEERKRERESGI